MEKKLSFSMNKSLAEIATSAQNSRIRMDFLPVCLHEVGLWV